MSFDMCGQVTVEIDTIFAYLTAYDAFERVLVGVKTVVKQEQRRILKHHSTVLAFMYTPLFQQEVQELMVVHLEALGYHRPFAI